MPAHVMQLSATTQHFQAEMVELTLQSNGAGCVERRPFPNCEGLLLGENVQRGLVA